MAFSSTPIMRWASCMSSLTRWVRFRGSMGVLLPGYLLAGNAIDLVLAAVPTLRYLPEWYGPRSVFCTHVPTSLARISESLLRDGRSCRVRRAVWLPAHA